MKTCLAAKSEQNWMEFKLLVQAVEVAVNYKIFVLKSAFTVGPGYHSSSLRGQ